MPREQLLARAAISSGSAIRPTPTSPSASLALLRADQLDAARAQHRRVRLRRRCSHMRGFIAGATSIGPRCASAASVSTLSASPCASFASVFAVSGAITSRSARSRCGYGSSLGDLRASARERLGPDEPLGAPRRRAASPRARPDEQPHELAGLVGRDAAGDPEQDARHRPILPARDTAVAA